MQKLDFNNDGKLVAYTDNGCTDGKSATTEINGIFDVSADVVKFILAKEYDLPAAIGAELGKERPNGYRFYHLFCLIGNDEQERILQEYRNKVDELSNAENELKRLRKAVDDFNKNARFYERKIKIGYAKIKRHTSR